MAPVDLIIVNGTSSSGKTSIIKCLQETLTETWLTFGVDTLISGLPIPLLAIDDDAQIALRVPRTRYRDGGMTLHADGHVSVGPEYRRVEAAFYDGVTAMMRAGVGIILDEVFLEGSQSQERLRAHFPDATIVWIGVTCDRAVATERERLRGDRVIGMVAAQLEQVHKGVDYDFVVASDAHSPRECADDITNYLGGVEKNDATNLKGLDPTLER
jgi:chloramphenicol 3-O phosphotransferase